MSKPKHDSSDAQSNQGTPSPVMEVTMLPVSEANFATYNPRRKVRRGTKEFNDIANSIRTYGMVQNIVWNRRTKNIIAGHQRTHIGIEEFGWREIPVKVVDLDDQAEKALNIILNKVGEGNWDDSALQTLLEEIKERGEIDLYSLGFGPVEIDKILGTKPKKTIQDPDEAVAPPANPKTRQGDIYRFVTSDGLSHVLVCGDSTKNDPYEAALKTGIKPARVYFTDPPYGVSYASKAKSGKMKRQDLQNDELREDGLQEFLTKAFSSANTALQDQNPVAYIFYAFSCHIPFLLALRAAGWQERQLIIWAKQMVLGRADYHWAHEPCFYAAKAGGKTDWFGDRAQTTLWEIKRDPPSSYVHPTQKPVALVQRAAKNSTIIGDTILDSFGGSGSTMIGSELAGRSSITIELDEGFCDAIAQRMVQTFDDVVVMKNGTEIASKTLIPDE